MPDTLIGWSDEELVCELERREVRHEVMRTARPVRVQSPSPVRPLSMSEVVNTAGELLGIDDPWSCHKGDESRDLRSVAVRVLVAGAAKHMTRCSYPEIARALGHGEFHGSVTSRIKRFNALPPEVQADWLFDLSRVIQSKRDGRPVCIDRWLGAVL